MRLDSPIARGRTADIYPWGNDLIIKLYHDWMTDDAIRYEATVAHAAHAAGLPVPAAGDVIDVNGQRGLLYERVAGPTMLAALQAKPWTLGSSARRLAELQATLHRHIPMAELLGQRERLADKIRQVSILGRKQCATVLSALAEMPEGNRLCHGDFHPANVILEQTGPVIIDWIDATCGNPLADVARTSLILLGEAHTKNTPWYEKIIIKRYHSVYLRAYFRLRPGGEAEYRAWRPIVAAARMSEGIKEIQAWLATKIA